MGLAMMFVDGSEKGKADPALAARMQPIGHRAMGVWNAWLPVQDMHRLVARGVARPVNAARPWQLVRGPGTALVATCARRYVGRSRMQ